MNDEPVADEVRHLSVERALQDILDLIAPDWRVQLAVVSNEGMARIEVSREHVYLKAYGWDNQMDAIPWAEPRQ
jgi:hypothetical protein